MTIMLRRHLLLVTIIYLSGGCQSKQPTHAVAQRDLPIPQCDTAVVASALVFDPPVAQDEPRLELSRADRQPRVAVGYEEMTAEYFDIRLDDSQIMNGFSGSGRHGSGGGGWGSYDRYERRAVTERVGVR